MAVRQKDTAWALAGIWNIGRDPGRHRQFVRPPWTHMASKSFIIARSRNLGGEKQSTASWPIGRRRSRERLRWTWFSTILYITSASDRGPRARTCCKTLIIVISAFLLSPCWPSHVEVVLTCLCTYFTQLAWSRGEEVLYRQPDPWTRGEVEVSHTEKSLQGSKYVRTPKNQRDANDARCLRSRLR